MSITAPLAETCISLAHRRSKANIIHLPRIAYHSTYVWRIFGARADGARWRSTIIMPRTTGLEQHPRAPCVPRQAFFSFRVERAHPAHACSASLDYECSSIALTRVKSDACLHSPQSYTPPRHSQTDAPRNGPDEGPGRSTSGGDRRFLCRHHFSNRCVHPRSVFDPMRKAVRFVT